ncbi:MAG: hypothetical protein WC671_00335 [Candidatus Paceibacterota bacterium]
MKTDLFRLGSATKEAMRVLPGVKITRTIKGVRISFLVPKTNKESEGSVYLSEETAAQRAISRWKRMQKKNKK